MSRHREGRRGDRGRRGVAGRGDRAGPARAGLPCAHVHADLRDDRRRARPRADLAAVGRRVRRLGAAEHRPPRRAGQEPVSTSTCARPGTSRTLSTAARCTGAPTTSAPRSDPAADSCAPPGHRRGRGRGAGGQHRLQDLHARGRNEGLDGDLSPYDSWSAYGTSKLALVHEAHEIERRYGARGLHGYSLHPGSVHTKIADPRPRDGPDPGPAAQAGRSARAPNPQVAGGRSANERVLRDLAERRCRGPTTGRRRPASPRTRRRTRRRAGSCGTPRPAGSSRADSRPAARRTETHRQLW